MSVRLENITYKIGGQAIVRDASTLIKSGHLTVIIGPNGAGKSTIVKLICGEMTPNSGAIFFNDTALPLLDLKAQARLRSVMTQSTSLAFDFTVRDILELSWSKASFSSFQARMFGLAEKNEVRHLLHQNFRTLSGGEQQRVLFTRALLQIDEPSASRDDQYLFLDEPTAHLDIKHELHTLQLCKEYTSAGLGVVAVLHDLNLAARFADRIILMKRGEIVSQGPTADVLTAKHLTESYETPIDVLFDAPKNRLFIYT